MAAQLMNSGVAGRYASALYDLAQEEKKVPAVASGLASLASAISGSDDLSHFLTSPVFKTEDQMAVVDDLASKLKLNDIAANFVRLMVQNRRLGALPGAIAAFDALVADGKGEVFAEVTSAEKLSSAQLKDISAALKSRVGKDVQLVTKTDDSLLGGLVVKIGSTQIDNSLKTKLSNLKVSMKGTA